MKDHARVERQKKIETAAYQLLAESGYAGTSMLKIARRARCSNETLYNWYGDKLGLFRTMVARNAEDAKSLLETALCSGNDPLDSLKTFGPILLELLLGDRAVTLNRAAAGDPSGDLGKALAAAGRDTIAPLVGGLFKLAQEKGQLKFETEGGAVETYLGLLIGDLQIRRIIGRLPEPDKAFIENRAQDAYQHTLALFGRP